MSPKEAGLLDIEEPNWQEAFESDRRDGHAIPKELKEDAAFKSVLKRWRRFHAVGDKPATAYEGMVALARLRIFPPRSIIKDIERTGACFKDQHDSQMWLTMSQRAWRIIAVESRVLFLESFGEQTQVDLSRARWEKYCGKSG